MVGEVPVGDYRVPLCESKIIKKGSDITIVSMSYMTIEAVHAIEHIINQDITCDLIDLRTVHPIDYIPIISSVKKTGNLLVLDTATKTGSISSEIIAELSSICWSYFKSAPIRLAMPDAPEGTSPALTKKYHIRSEDIIQAIGKILKKDLEFNSLIIKKEYPHDVPGDWFSGPF